jgi:hypothetical protein
MPWARLETLPKATALRWKTHSHKSGGRPAPPDGSAEYDFRFRAEEKLAVYLAAVARLVHCESAA